MERAAIRDLASFSDELDTEFGITSSMSGDEVEAEMRSLGLEPNKPIVSSGAYGYVSDEPLENECGDDMRILIFGIRHLARQRRYEEALDLAILATDTDPNYWRAWISRASLLIVLEQVAAGNRIFELVVKEFSDNSKAIAAGLHGLACVKEIEGDFKEAVKGFRESLKHDASRANTRACTVVHALMLEPNDNQNVIIEDSAICGGFFDALRFELNERGTKTTPIIERLPSWLRHFLYPIRPLIGEGEF